MVPLHLAISACAPTQIAIIKIERGQEYMIYHYQVAHSVGSCYAPKARLLMDFFEKKFVHIFGVYCQAK